MISSTRSSESASRSSWKDAASTTSASSTPSCSTRTTFTRSKTSSREAAMSPLLAVGTCGGRDANTVLRRLSLESVAELRNDAVLDAARCKPDRVRDRAPRRVAVRDDDDAAETEEICTAKLLRIEARTKPPRGGAD